MIGSKPKENAIHTNNIILEKPSKQNRIVTLQRRFTCY